MRRSGVDLGKGSFGLGTGWVKFGSVRLGSGEFWFGSINFWSNKSVVQKQTTRVGYGSVMVNLCYGSTFESAYFGYGSGSFGSSFGSI